MIDTSGFNIIYDGDLSVGISSVTWELKGDFSFDSLDDLNAFKNGLCELFGIFSDSSIRVETIEEMNTRYYVTENLLLFHEEA